MTNSKVILIASGAGVDKTLLDALQRHKIQPEVVTLGGPAEEKEDPMADILAEAEKRRIALQECLIFALSKPCQTEYVGDIKKRKKKRRNKKQRELPWERD